MLLVVGVIVAIISVAVTYLVTANSYKAKLKQKEERNDLPKEE